VHLQCHGAQGVIVACSFCRTSDQREKGRGAMANPFVHVELMSNDLEASKKFYKSLFDWKIEEAPEVDYTMIKVGEGTGGGMLKNPMPGTPSSWLAYVQVSDVASSTTRAKELGAKVLKEKTVIPGMGAYSVIADPQGAPIAMWERAKK
jgi:predicted enzyme related to lactoylglutathione lyase